MKALRWMTALAAAAAVLFGGAWAGGAVAGRSAPAPSAAAGTYPGGRDVVRVGEGLAVGGQSMQLSMFRTGDPPARIARFYADAFRARGLTPVMSNETSLAHVAAFDPGDGLQRFVTAVGVPRGETVVMLGSTNPRIPPRFVESGERGPFPVPAGHRGYLAFRSADAGSTAESAQFVTPLSPRAVASFYRATLAAEGYRDTSEARDEGLLTFLKRGSAVSLAMQSLDERSGTGVFITRAEGDVR